MTTNVKIEAGVCGFHTTVKAECTDQQHVDLQIESTCDKIKNLAKTLEEINPIDAYQEIMPTSQSQILKCACETLNGCCSGCVVPSGIYKAMQVAAGLALPKDISIQFME